MVTVVLLVVVTVVALRKIKNQCQLLLIFFSSHCFVTRVIGHGTAKSTEATNVWLAYFWWLAVCFCSQVQHLFEGSVNQINTVFQSRGKKAPTCYKN